MNSVKARIFAIIAIDILVVAVGIQFIYSIMQKKVDAIEPEKVYIHDVEIKTVEKEVYVDRFVEVERDVPEVFFFKSVCLDADCIMQNPELPTGCEVTSLAIILNYYGYNIDKVTLAEKYLPKGKIGETFPYDAFIGNPKKKNAYGAYAPVLVNTANAYLHNIESRLNALDVTGSTMTDLLSMVKDGFPVMTWVTMDMQKPHKSTTWEIDGKKFTWLANEHCVVIIGFTENTFIVADPLKGIVEYNQDIFKEVYKAMGKQAVVIR